jgi:hypothetical protein
MDVVREIDRVDAKEMSRDTSGTRALSQFLVEVAERMPEQLQPCLTLLMKHLVSLSKVSYRNIKFVSKCVPNFDGFITEDNRTNTINVHFDQRCWHSW